MACGSVGIVVSGRVRASLRFAPDMPPSPNLASPQPPAAAPAPIPPRHDRWLRRADLILQVIVRLYLGLILVFLPWTHLWTFNRFFLYFAPVARLTASGAVRGLVSGLGLLNLWIAIFDAIHYKES
ncbi:MAG TPA: hypothetical protein VME18_02255 [Acidobacteriaceae bacterium]|nr:hypothetical protein [Acidobacteriaceae bacterium]